MWQERLLTSSAASSNVSVRIAIKMSQPHQTIKMGAICVRLRSNLMLDSNFSGNFTVNHVPLPLVALSMLNNDIGNTFILIFFLTTFFLLALLQH
jgi:hypothetical protein